MSSSRGELFILSGPSGSGKTSLIRGLLASELGDLDFSVSHTTRSPRLGEVDGGDYHFVSREAFEGMAASGRFLEWARVHDHFYGTSLDEVLPRLERGVDVLLDIDVQGARQVLDHRGSGLAREDVHGIFVLPPSYQELRTRLVRRRLDDDEVIGRRLTVALQEIRAFENYEYVIINRDIDKASRALVSIILEKRHRQRRMRDQVAVVLEGFERTRTEP